MSGILVVEDDVFLAEVLCDCLEDFGYAVAGVAGTAEEGVRLATERSPDLVLMDVGLPGASDGIEAARRIGEGPRTPVVFLTGCFDEGALARAEAVRPYGYLLKPFHPASLLATVRTALGRAAIEAGMRESEARLVAVVEGSTDAILLVDQATGEVLQRNPALYALLGRNGGSPLTIAGILAGDVPRDLSRAIREPRETFVRRADGGLVAVEMTAHPVASGGRETLCVFLRDVSGRSPAREAILRAKVEWEQTFDAIPDLVSILDREGKIVRLNRAMAGVVGLAPEEAVGQSCSDLVHGLGSRPAGRPLAAFACDGLPREAEVFLPALGRTFLETVAPLLDASGGVTGSVLVARDITDLRRAEAETRLRERFLERLNGLTERVLATEDLPVLFQLAAEGTRDLFGADAAALVLWDAADETTQVVAAAGAVPPDVVGTRSGPGEGTLVQETLRKGRPLLLQDAGAFPGSERLLSLLGTTSAAAFPLSAGEPIGMLLAGWSQGHLPSPSEVSLGELAARQVSLALLKARLHDEVRRQAVTDSLTGLRNRRGFLDLARREMDRALRFHRPLAVLALDVDLFKEINDALGHAAGDDVLKGVAELLASVLREVDVLGRTGGDEFSVILPECEGATALEIAERIRRVVVAAPFESLRGPVPATVSIGIGLLEGDVHDLPSLLDLADGALYEAKQAGRNHVALGPAREGLSRRASREGKLWETEPEGSPPADRRP